MDDKYQIQEANFSEPVFALNGYRPQGNRYRLTNMSYDPNGNIQTLRRFNGTGQVQHDFAYTYRQKAPGVTYNQLDSVTGYSTYEYNAIGQMIKADKTEEGADQYVDYDVTGKVVAVYKDANRSQPVTRYAYDDRGFRMAKITYPNGSGDATTTWYIRDAGGNILSIYEQKGIGIAVGSGAASAEPPVQKEVPVYGSGKIGTYYPAHSQLADQAGHEAGSTAYEITDHLGNVRALLRSHVNEYTATLEDDGTATYTNPRVRENVYFKNLWASEKRDAQMNHTGTVVTPAPDRSAYLRWVGGQAGMDAQQKSVGPAIALAVKAGDRINASAWARFKVKASYSRAPLQNIIASVLSGQYAYSNGLESIAQAANTFNAGLLGLAPNGGDNPNAPSAYLNYILFDTTYQRLDAGAVQVPQAAGFEGPQRGNGYTANNLLKFENAIEVSQPGYLYVWVSNESEDTEVWFDDLNVVHHTTLVAQATDYEVWGGVLREQRYNPDENYRYGYQGQYSEHDEETNWNHFELREYDPVIGRTITTDPAGQFWSSYMWVGNNPISGVDPTGGFSTHTDKDGNVVKVYNDGDLGIYRHDDLSKWDGVSILSKSGNGISMMGETAFWDEFLSPETGKEFGKINFGASWDGVLDELHQKSKTMNLIEMAQNSKAGKLFDLKKDYPSEGRLLDGKYISSRSAGNYLAAFNAAFGKYGIVGVNFTGFMKLAGALHVHGKLGIELSKSEMGLLLTNSHKGDGPAPAYGENSYCYRMCSYGWGKARVGNFGWSNVMGIK
jgi:RHS repeat-associated protein